MVWAVDTADDETDEILRDKALMESIKRGLRDIENGDVEDFDEFVKSIMRSIKQKPKRSFEEFLSELGVEI